MLSLLALVRYVLNRLPTPSFKIEKRNNCQRKKKKCENSTFLFDVKARIRTRKPLRTLILRYNEPTVFRIHHFGTDPDPDPWIRTLDLLIRLRLLLFSSETSMMQTKKKLLICFVPDPGGPKERAWRTDNHNSESACLYRCIIYAPEAHIM
jgi:hypothetical protein